VSAEYRKLVFLFNDEPNCFIRVITAIRGVFFLAFCPPVHFAAFLRKTISRAASSLSYKHECELRG
jgi:hypothetical protein